MPPHRVVGRHPFAARVDGWIKLPGYPVSPYWGEATAYLLSGLFKKDEERRSLMGSW